MTGPDRRVEPAGAGRARGGPLARRTLCGVVAALLLIVARVHAQGVETLGEVRVHGNHTTPDADVLAVAGLTVGAPVTAEALAAAEERLRQSGRFAGVELRKRHRSIENPLDMLVVVIVDEHAAVSEDDLVPGAMRRVRVAGMWLPILDYEDGYGLTYGARVSFVEPLGPRSRVSVPLTWGGERRAGVTLDRVFERGPVTRLEGGLAVTRRVNPHADIADTRREARVRVERSLGPWLRAGAAARTTHVQFGGLAERYTTPALDLTLDTRMDPAYPRNAIDAKTTLEWLRFPTRAPVTRWSSDARGYLGLLGASVLAVRVTAVRSSDPLPLYEQPLVGGSAVLRGYRAGHRAGDNLLAVSGELRVPLTSPLRIGRVGLKAFIDAGAAYPAGGRLRGERFDRGIGGGVFFTATVFRAGLDVAWPRAGSPRWHWGLGATF